MASRDSSILNEVFCWSSVVIEDDISGGEEEASVESAYK